MRDTKRYCESCEKTTETKQTNGPHLFYSMAEKGSCSDTASHGTVLLLQASRHRLICT
ncbi:hypothetical protein YC2023_038751 [Brassica napus]